MANKSSNKYLHKASQIKNDEFYTQLSDIERELSHYKDHFKNKIVFCNCDDPRVSSFFHYFSYNFEFLELKKLITTCYKNQLDKTIDHLQKTKDALLLSDNNLRLANNKAEDLTIKRLTRGNPIPNQLRFASRTA